MGKEFERFAITLQHHPSVTFELNFEPKLGVKVARLAKVPTWQISCDAQRVTHERL